VKRVARFQTDDGRWVELWSESTGELQQCILPNNRTVRPEDKSEKGQADGYAPLDSSAKVPATNLGTGTADATKYLRGDLAWAVPGGTGGYEPDLVTIDLTITSKLHVKDGVFDPLGAASAAQTAAEAYADGLAPNYDPAGAASGAVTAHAALTTGIHGVGASTVASAADVAGRAPKVAGTDGHVAVVDGTGAAQGFKDGGAISGLSVSYAITAGDADTLDGQHSTAFETAGAVSAHNGDASAHGGAITKANSAVQPGDLASASVNYANTAGSAPANGGNADTLDGQHAVAFEAAGTVATHASTVDHPVMTGDGGAGGAKGMVPPPGAGDASKFLRGDGTWQPATSDPNAVTSAAVLVDNEIVVGTGGARNVDSGAPSGVTLEGQIADPSAPSANRVRLYNLQTNSGIDSYTKLCIKVNGAHGSASFRDASFTNPPPIGTTSYRKTVTSSNCTVNTSVTQFGTGSYYFNGISAYLYLSDAVDWYLGTGDWTIDFWIQHASVPAATMFYWEQSSTGGNRFLFGYNQALSSLAFYVQSAGVEKANYLCPWVPVPDTWYHVELSRYNQTNLYLFIDGIQKTWNVPATAIGTNEMPNINGDLDIGRSLNDSNWYFYGYMEEFRWNKGVCRHISDFSVQTTVYDGPNITFLSADGDKWILGGTR